MGIYTGTTGNDTLNGSIGNDTLYGAAGNDLLQGSTGNDTYRYQLGTGSDVINDTGGADIVLLSDPNNLYASLDIYRSGTNLILDGFSAGKITVLNQFTTGKIEYVTTNDGWGPFAIQNGLIGTTGADLIVGTTAAESLAGGLGGDWMWGGSGNDTVNGGNGENELHGGLGNDSLIGGIDSDDLYGEIGNDTLSGGSGWDDACYDGQTAGIFVNLSGLNQAYDNRLFASGKVYETVAKTTDTLSSIEQITCTSYADYVVLGRTGNTEINPSKGNDTIVGGSDNNTSWSNIGYWSDPSGIIVNLSNQALAATIGSTTYYVGRNTTRDGWGNTDTYITTDTSFNITGSNYTDYIRGRDDNNTDNTHESFSGGEGNDTIDGGSGLDQANYSTDDGPYGVLVNLSAASVNMGGITVASGTARDNWRGTDTLKNIENINGSNLNDYILGSSANNYIHGGNTGNDTLNGGAGNDNINGGSGNDSLIGGDGSDWLSGGIGNDIFDFNSISESGITSATWDIISDLVRGQDKIDLSTIDANTATTTNDAFSGLIASSTAFSVAGQLKLVGNVLYGNTDTDSTAEFAINFSGISTLTSSDFIL